MVKVRNLHWIHILWWIFMGLGKKNIGEGQISDLIIFSTEWLFYSLFPSVYSLVSIWCNCIVQCEEVCYDDLGCFSNDPPYDSLLGFPPQPPDEVNVRFFLYTRVNRDLWMEISRKDPESLATSVFHPGSKTVFYIHGWNNVGYRSSFAESLRNALLDLVSCCFMLSYHIEVSVW